MYRRKEGKMKVTIGAHTGLILTLPLSVSRGRCSKIICRELHFAYSLQSAQIQVLNDKNEIILLHLPHARGKFLKIAQVKPGELLSN